MEFCGATLTRPAGMAVGKVDPLNIHLVALLHCYLADAERRFYNPIPIILYISIWQDHLICGGSLLGDNYRSHGKIKSKVSTTIRYQKGMVQLPEVHLYVCSGLQKQYPDRYCSLCSKLSRREQDTHPRSASAGSIQQGLDKSEFIMCHFLEVLWFKNTKPPGIPWPLGTCFHLSNN